MVQTVRALSAKLEDLSSTLAHMLEGKYVLLDVVLKPPHMSHVIHTHEHTQVNKQY